MRLLFAFYILFSVVLDSCHAIAEVDATQTSIVSSDHAQVTISKSHLDCGETHTNADLQPHYCHFTHCTFLIPTQIRIPALIESHVRPGYFFIEPQAAVRRFLRPPKV